MHFVPAYSIIVMLTIATAALNTDTVSQARNKDKALLGQVGSHSKGKGETKEDINKSKQDDVDPKRVTSQREAINNVEPKSKKITTNIANSSQIITNSPEDIDSKSKVTEDQPDLENYSEGSNLSSRDNEVTEGESFLSDLLDDYYEDNNVESDGLMKQTQSTTNQPKAKNNVKSGQVSREIKQIDSLEQDNEITLEDNNTLQTKLKTARHKANYDRSKSKNNKTDMNLDTPIAKDQHITPDNTKSELEINAYKTNEVEPGSEATDSSKSDDTIINYLELNMNAQPQDINGIASNSTAGGVKPELTTNLTTASLRPIKHRQSLCSRLFKLIRSIFFPWRRLYNKLKCTLHSPTQGSRSQNISNIM